MAKTDIFFSEIYSSYFRIVEQILRRAQKRELMCSDIDEKKLYREVFGESHKFIPEKLKTEEWPLLLQDESTGKMSTPLKNSIGTPLTILEKRWLKTLLLDPRIKLFNVDGTGLEDVEPLFKPEQFVYFDQYADGDDYSDPIYQEHFKTLLQACEKKQLVEISFTNNRGVAEKHVYLPLKLEYSSKDDKFRLRAERQPEANKPGDFSFVNLGRISACTTLEKLGVEATCSKPERSTIVLELKDERNALERVLLHFSSLEKKTQKLDDEHYRIELTFNEADRAEMLIRVLSFGPVIKLVRPKEMEKDKRYKGMLVAQKEFWNELHKKLDKQKELLRSREKPRYHEGMSR